MKSLLIGMTLGALAGAFAFKKIEERNLPEKAIKLAQKKLEEMD